MMSTLHRLTMPAWGRPRPLFRWLHRWLGLIAGLVLAVVGGTGAIMSFQDDLLRWMNPDVMQVAVPEGKSALPLPELVARIQSQKSSPPIATLRLSGAPGDSAWVGFRARGKPEGEFVNPYTGDLLGKARGEVFFHVVEDLHRRLLAGNTGKAITGASALIFLAILISGAIVRLRRAGLKYWLVPTNHGSWGARIHSLHSVLGVWFLLPFLLVTLTGLYWSYGWSRTLWHEATGAPKGKPMAQKLAVANHEAPDLQAIAERLATLSATRVQIFWPARPDEAMRVIWQDSKSPHGRAFNTLQLEPVTAAVLSEQPFASLPFGTRLVRSMFALHSGEYFGLTGMWIMFLVSLSLPLFFISGLWLYLRRRVRIKPDVLRDPVAADATPVLVAYASQTGTAQSVAQATAKQLLDAGQPVIFRPIEALRVDDLLAVNEALLVVSTYGEGEAPDHAQGVIEQLSLADRSLSRLRFAILALGDRQYPNFCGFGVALRDRLLLANATERFPILKVDQADPAVIQEWFAHLASRWRSTPTTVDSHSAEWTLTQRQLLNPSGMGLPTFEIELALTDPRSVDWQAGALIDITPQHTSERVARWLDSAGLDGAQYVVYGGKEQRLVDVLQHCELPEGDSIISVPDVQSWLSTLRRLGARSYSVASLPTDGVVRLLVRQVRTPGGELGVSSGWLTSHLSVGQKLTARLRQNPSFLPMTDAEVPCLFIANGTGMSGIRAHIQARIAVGATRNWVILGERSPQDAYWQAQWRLWEAQGAIERMDWVYSRLPTSGTVRYVQHQLGTAHTALKNYLDEDAVVFVCGSASGMAPAVDAVLSNVLGNEEWQAFRRSNRYRRDVY